MHEHKAAISSMLGNEAMQAAHLAAAKEMRPS